MENFNDKTILITGAGGGLGQATAIAFAKSGASLSLADIDQTGLEKTRQLITDAGGTAPLLHSTDLRLRENCLALVEHTISHFHQLDVLCNIAGILAMSRTENVTEDLWNNVMAINLSAPFWLSQAAIPHLVESQGNIVNVASTGAFKGEAYLAPYTASKAALVQLTKSMAMEFLKEPIRINAIAPGGMITNMGNADQFPTDLDMELVQHFMPKRPPVDAALVADSILYLSSERAANMHGSCLMSDGAHTAG